MPFVPSSSLHRSFFFFLLSHLRKKRCAISVATSSQVQVMPNFEGAFFFFSRSAAFLVHKTRLCAYATCFCNILTFLFTPHMSPCSYQWPGTWSFYMPLPSPLCALVNVRRTRWMDACVNPVGDMRDDNSSGQVSRIYETHRQRITCNPTAKRAHHLPVSFWFSRGDKW